MKKSSSTPSLTGLATVHVPVVPPLPRLGNIAGKRNMSTNALSSLEYISDMGTHIQIEAVTHSSAYNTGMCLAEFGSQVNMNVLSFPNKELLSLENQEAAKALLTCMVTPHEHVEDESEHRNMNIIRAIRYMRRKKETGDLCLA